MRSVIATAVVIAWSVFAVAGADQRDDRIRTSAARALTLLQSSQKRWYTRQTCSSCHHQFQPALAYRSARAHGIPFDDALAHADAVKAFSYTDLDEAVQYAHVIEPAMDDGYRLMAADAAGVKPNLVTAVYARMIGSRQNSSGDWPSFHQRPPLSYSSFTMTAVAIRALQIYSHLNHQTDARARIARGRDWLLAHAPPDTEGKTYQLLGLSWSGVDRSTIGKFAAALMASQQADGGWNSLDGRASDAYSTGQALVALHDAAGTPTTDAAWQRGLAFLLKTQAVDGSWHVVSRLHPPAPVSPPYFNTGYPYVHDQFISAAGASWATMALALALPESQSAAPSLKEAEPSGIEPWMETMLFGTAGDLKRLLDAGFDPNSATRPGGTTALMIAVPSVEKMTMLLDRGADVNARAKTGFSALMVATQHRNGSPALRLLLDRGAQVRPASGQPPPLFNAHPVFLAAYAGNAEVLPRLREEGGSLNEPMSLIGLAPVTPLMAAAALDHVDVVQALLAMGVPVDELDPDGITALGWAAIGNQIELARRLIARGADVNHVDRKGMTPLLYAASIDFGDSAMIDLLVKSGARLDVRTKAGLTPLDLARQYKHTHLIASLAVH
jgi:ankyrin repeat protein